MIAGFKCIYKFIDIVPPSHFLISAGCDAGSWIIQQWWNNAINYTKSPWNRFHFWLTFVHVHRGYVECNSIYEEYDASTSFVFIAVILYLFAVFGILFSLFLLFLVAGLYILYLQVSPPPLSPIQNYIRNTYRCLKGVQGVLINLCGVCICAICCNPWFVWCFDILFSCKSLNTTLPPPLLSPFPIPLKSPSPNSGS